MSMLDKKLKNNDEDEDILKELAEALSEVR